MPWDYKHKGIDFIQDYNFCPHCGAIMDAFDEYVDSNEPHWIPVEQDLPEKSGEYLVTVKWVTGESDVDG